MWPWSVVVAYAAQRSRMASASGRSRVSTAASRCSGGSSPRQASTVSRSSAIRPPVCSSCWSWWTASASLARACIRCICRTNMSARSSSVRAIWPWSSAAISASRFGSTISAIPLAVRVRASAAKERALAVGMIVNTAVPAPCARSQARWRRKSRMFRGVGRFGSVFTRSQAVRAWPGGRTSKAFRRWRTPAGRASAIRRW
jgi:hypothetical protein